MTLCELFCAVCEERYFHLHPSEVSYRIRRVGRRTVHILFEWSHGMEDWLGNLDFCPVRTVLSGERLLVHRGFLRAYLAVRERLHCALSDGAIGRLIVGGYSHGAALCALTVADTHALCQARGIEVAGVGFGAPRVLWGFGKPTVLRRFLAVRCGHDLVTHLPPRALGFSHGSTLLSLPAPHRMTPWDAHREASYRTALAASGDGSRGVFSFFP